MIRQWLKRVFWTLPVKSEIKDRISALRYESILKREAKLDKSLEISITEDASILRNYSEYVLSSYGVKSKKYCEYIQHETKSNDITLVAYYLTQFHPTPQNDLWWGKGVTEWNNVDQAIPQFPGHYQPRRPGELGYYDLRIDDVMLRQIELAKNYGVGVFCFYHYWFNGQRLLEYPLNKFLSDEKYDMPFFYCWANENWTKRYSGTNSDVLMAIEPTVDSYQSYIDSVLQDFTDRRYFKIAGKPVLSIYRPSLVPETERVLDYWRRRVWDVLGTDLYIIAIQERDVSIDWTRKGYDAEAEFQPKRVEHHSTIITKRVHPVRRDFGGTVYDYKDLVMNRKYKADRGSAKAVYPAVMPMWDNTARRNHRGTIFHGSSPDLYRMWLRDAVEYMRSQSGLEGKMVFINAWNEWGEGAYLEPDRYYGYAYLEATWRAMSEGSDEE